jgi:hypothetical protein
MRNLSYMENTPKVFKRRRKIPITQNRLRIRGKYLNVHGVYDKRL